jgi:hypothetical protein
VRKIQERSTWAAAESAKYRDIVNNDDFFDEGSDLREQARLMSGEVEPRFHEVLDTRHKRWLAAPILNAALGTRSVDILRPASCVR